MVRRVGFVRSIARCCVVSYQQRVEKRKKKKGERPEGYVSNPDSHPPIDVLEEVSFWAA